MTGTLSVQKIQGLATSAAPTTVEIASAHKITGNITHGTSSVFPAGHIIQIVVKTSSSSTTIGGSSLTTFGLSQSFTPKFASSNILIIGSLAGEHYSANDQGLRVDLTKDGSQFRYWAYLDYHSSDASQNISIQTLQWYGTVDNTNARTYEFRACSSNSGGTARINQYNSPSTMTIMEIAG